MGKLVTLGSVLTVLATLFALVLKFAMPGQIVVAALSTTFIAVAFWKINYGFRANDVNDWL